MKLHFLKLEEENQSSNPSNLKNQKKKKNRSLNDEIDEWINLLEIEEDKKNRKKNSETKNIKNENSSFTSISNILVSLESDENNLNTNFLKSFFSNQSPLPRDEIIPGDEKSLFYLELLRPEFGEFPEKISLPTWPIIVKKSITGLFFQCENFQKKTDFSKINKNEEQNTEKEETLSWITKSDSQKLNSNLLILDPNLSIPRLSFNDSLTASIGEFGLSFNYTQSLENTQTQKNEENQKENFIKKLNNEEVIESNHSVKLKINYLENKFRNL